MDCLFPLILIVDVTLVPIYRHQCCCCELFPISNTTFMGCLSPWILNTVSMQQTIMLIRNVSMKQLCSYGLFVRRKKKLNYCEILPGNNTIAIGCFNQKPVLLIWSVCSRETVFLLWTVSVSNTVSIYSTISPTTKDNIYFVKPNITNNLVAHTF